MAEDTRPYRTDAEIVEQTVALTKYLLDWKWGLVHEDDASRIWESKNTKAQVCWNAACHIQDLLTQTDVLNAVANIEGEVAVSNTPYSDLDRLHDLLYTAQRSTGEIQAKAIGKARVLLSNMRAAPVVQKNAEPIGEVVVGEGPTGGNWNVIKWREDAPPIYPGMKLYTEPVAVIGPMREAPVSGSDYWRLMPTGGWAYIWTGSEEDFSYLRNGLAFATREALAAHLVP